MSDTQDRPHEHEEEPTLDHLFDFEVGSLVFVAPQPTAVRVIERWLRDEDGSPPDLMYNVRGPNGDVHHVNEWELSQSPCELRKPYRLQESSKVRASLDQVFSFGLNSKVKFKQAPGDRDFDTNVYVVISRNYHDDGASWWTVYSLYAEGQKLAVVDEFALEAVPE